MNDAKAIAGTVAVNGATGVVTGAGTTFTNYETGDVLSVGGGDYIILSVANTTSMTVTSGQLGTEMATVAANSVYSVSDKPLYVGAAEVGGDLSKVYGVSTTEMNTANTSSEASSVAHAGWVRRTEGTGGRAGRVQYEVLVAGSSIAGDAEDDAILPEV